MTFRGATGIIKKLSVFNHWKLFVVSAEPFTNRKGAPVNFLTDIV